MSFGWRLRSRHDPKSRARLEGHHFVVNSRRMAQGSVGPLMCELLGDLVEVIPGDFRELGASLFDDRAYSLVIMDGLVIVLEGVHLEALYARLSLFQVIGVERFEELGVGGVALLAVARTAGGDEVAESVLA